MPEFYNLSAAEALEALGSSHKGLSSAEAEKRLKEHGPNVITEEDRIHPLKIFLDQFRSPLVWILIAAMAISFAVKERIDFYVIGAIVVINAFLGFLQEYKAEKSIIALKKLISLKATVLRDGDEKEINAEELVPGDVVLLETGDKVPADARAISVFNLEAQEAALTGESVPVAKHSEAIKKEAAVADRDNMVFSGTIVTKGRGTAVVTSTGMETEIGKIAGIIQKTTPELTPLQKKLLHLGKFLGIAVIIITFFVFGAGILTGKPKFQMFLAAIALAVAAIPEGLPAVVTLALSLGVQKMTRKNALIRRLPSVETLGACTVICSDKTGTLTHNEMTVKKIYANREIIHVEGSGYEPEGRFSKEPKGFELLLKAGVLNNNSKLKKENSEWLVIGDPTEAALLVSAKKAGIDVEYFQEQYPRIEEIEFSSESKRMTTVHEKDSKRIAFTKGAPEVVLSLCRKLLLNGKIHPLSRREIESIMKANEEFAKEALRVLGFAYKEIAGKEEAEKDMVFIGLQAMIDPPRKEAREAIAKCRTAGIKVVMITGDHLSTAKAIAKDLGIEGRAVSGLELEKMEDFDSAAEDIAIYARVNPAHKLKIIEALKKKKHIVAMTGDGVNDAPALKKADIGIAMGITGTDVAKEASDMVLADDNFASIVGAVEEGRIIFDNVKKFVEYLLSSNMGEVLTILIAILLGLPLPLIALQILWINLVTDGLPALALGMEPPEKGIMHRKPRKIEENIVNKRRGVTILLIGIIMMLGTLAIFDRYKPELNLAYAQTVAFTTLMMFQMFNVVNMRSEEESVFKLGLFSNKWLIGAVALSVLLQVAVIYIPFLNTAFGTIPLKAIDWVWSIAISASVLVFGEVVKKWWG